MTCNECRKYPGCMERSREYICREFKYDGGYNKSEASRIGNSKINEVEIKLKLSEDLLKLDSISKIPEASLMYIRKACGLNTAIWSTAEMKLQEE